LIGKESIMVDFLGKEIHMGDKIVYCRSRSGCFDMIKTEVIGFTEKMVRIDKIRSWSDKDYARSCSTNCIVYE